MTAIYIIILVLLATLLYIWYSKLQNNPFSCSIGSCAEGLPCAPARNDARGGSMLVERFEIITESEAARQLQVSIGGLRKWRREGSGPRFIKINRLVRYSLVDLQDWLTKHTVERDPRLARVK